MQREKREESTERREERGSGLGSAEDEQREDRRERREGQSAHRAISSHALRLFFCGVRGLEVVDQSGHILEALLALRTGLGSEQYV